MQASDKSRWLMGLQLVIFGSIGAAVDSQGAQAQEANCNLAPNPAFEQGTSTSISGWSFYVGAGAGVFSVSNFPSPVQSGARAAQVVVTQPGDVLLYTGEPGTIPVLPSTTYRMSARVKADPYKQAGFRVIEWTSQGTGVADNFIAYNSGNATGDWETVEGTVTTHANSAFVSLRLSHHVSTGTFIWDDVMFARDDAQRCVDLRHYNTQVTPGFKLCAANHPTPAVPTVCHGAIKTAGKEFLRTQVGWDGTNFTTQGYDYTSHTLASRAMVGVLKTQDSINGWRCFSNTDEACGAARTSPGQNAQFPPFGLQQSLTLPVLAHATIPSTTRTSGAALIHDWQLVGVRALDPSTVQSGAVIGNIWDRTWAYVLSSFDFGGDIGVQSNVLVYESEAIGDSVSPYGFGGGERLERYIFVRGFGIVYQEGQESSNCRSVHDAVHCDGSYPVAAPGPAWFRYRINGGLSIQDPLDPSNAGAGTFNVVDWW
jgi:hypothetical protein